MNVNPYFLSWSWTTVMLKKVSQGSLSGGPKVSMNSQGFSGFITKCSSVSTHLDSVDSSKQWSGIFLGIIGWDPSVCKSNRLHVDILRFSFIGFVCRIETMHQLFSFKSKFPNHFAFTLGRYLFLLFWV